MYPVLGSDSEEKVGISRPNSEPVTVLTTFWLAGVIINSNKQILAELHLMEKSANADILCLNRAGQYGQKYYHDKKFHISQDRYIS